jgi:hypothetical protein
MGMYQLILYVTANGRAAIYAGVVFAFGGLTQYSLMWPNNLAALSLMPWVICQVIKGCRRGGFVLATAAIVGTMQMLSGAPEIILMTWLVTGLSLPFFSATSWPSWRTILFRLVGIVFFVGMASSGQLLPFLELLAQSHRSASTYDSSWALPVWGWANFLLPQFHCHASHYGGMAQTGQNWTASYYAGSVTVALALCFPVLKHRTKALLFWAIFLVGLLLAFGDSAWIYGWLRTHFLPVRLMRFPIKWVVLCYFSLIVLASLAIAGLESSARRSDRKPKRWLLVVGFGYLLAIALLLNEASHHLFPSDDWSGLSRNGWSRILLLASGLFPLWLFLTSTSRMAQTLLFLMFLVVTVLDLQTHMPGLAPTTGTAVLKPGLLADETERLGHLKYPEGRALVPRYLQKSYEFRIFETPELDLLASRICLLGNMNLVDEVPSVSGFFSLYLEDEWKLRHLWDLRNADTPNPLVSFLGVQRVLGEGGLTDWRLHPNAMPLLSTGQEAILTDEASLVEALSSPDFDPRSTILLSRQDAHCLESAQHGRAELTLDRFESHAIAFASESSQPAFALVAQFDYPKWTASIDGQKAKIIKANIGFQCLEIPPGRHAVKIIYRDTGFRLSFLASNFILGIGLWRVIRRLNQVHGTWKKMKA